MAETAESIIKSALQEILVQGVEAPIQADEAQDAITYLNRLMAKLSAQGIALGYTAVTDLGDPITVDDGALDGVVKNLALSLFPQYSAPGTPINPLLVQQANDGLAAMRAIAIQSIGPGYFPSTLPVGSGNTDSLGRSDRFYTDPDTPVLGETGGYISVENET
jgi:hypothetical protein